MPRRISKALVSTLLSLGSFFAVIDAHAGNLLHTYPIPPGVPASRDFSVKVRIPGGIWKNLDCYSPEVNMRKPSSASMTYFDFTGTAEVVVVFKRGAVKAIRIRPLSFGIHPEVRGNSIQFSLAHPRNLSIEVNGDLFHNLHLFASAPDLDAPSLSDANVIYFGPGLHNPGPEIRLKDGQTVYLAGGAVVKTSLICDHVKNIRIAGRGVLDHSRDAIRIDYSDHVTVEGITVMNPEHYSVLAGNSTNLVIRNLKSFSSKGWGDGIDLFSSKHVQIENVFMRNSDDTIAIYGHRWDYYGDSSDIEVKDSVLWPDVAHPILVGTHGDFHNPEVIENLIFRNIDVLGQNEPQMDYQGCLALNASDGNLIRHVRVDGMRVEDIAVGQLVNMRVTFNKSYAEGPGRGIEDVYIKDLSYTGLHTAFSIISGYDDSRPIRELTFENLGINGRIVSDHMPGKPGFFKTSDMANMYVGDHVENVVFRTSAEAVAQDRTATSTSAN